MNLVPSAPLCAFCGDHEKTLENLLISYANTKTLLSVICWLNTYNMKVYRLAEVIILLDG